MIGTLIALLTTLFVGLKLVGSITWPWLWVVSPLWIAVTLWLSFVGTILLLTWLVE